MSGRSGYAKSDHPLLGRTRVIRPRRAPPTIAPLWRLSCDLPTNLAYAIALGPFPGLVGVSIVIGGRAVVEGRSIDWLYTQLHSLLKKIARDHKGGFFPAELFRDGTREKQFKIYWATGQPAMIVDGTSSRPMIFEG